LPAAELAKSSFFFVLNDPYVPKVPEDLAEEGVERKEQDDFDGDFDFNKEIYL
jgi:hypothetical protein